MKVVTLIKGKKLSVEHFLCYEKVSIKGNVDMMIFINENLQRRIRHLDDKCIVELFGKDMEIVTRGKDIVVITGNVVKYFIYDRQGRLGVIHYLTPSEFD
jgi:predicted RNase H-like nuclease